MAYIYNEAKLCRHCLMKKKGASTDYCNKCKKNHLNCFVDEGAKLTGEHHPTIRCESGVTFGW